MLVSISLNELRFDFIFNSIRFCSLTVLLGPVALLAHNICSRGKSISWNVRIIKILMGHVYSSIYLRAQSNALQVEFNSGWQAI